VCLSLAWERLEVYTTAADRQNMFFKEVGNNLERKCNGLMQSTHLLPYVQCVLATEIRDSICDLQEEGIRKNLSDSSALPN